MDKEYLDSLINNNIITISGMCGSGKSFLAFYISSYLVSVTKKELYVFGEDITVLYRRFSEKNINCIDEKNTDSIVKKIQLLNDAIIVIDDLIYLGMDYKLTRNFLRILSQLSETNNIQFIITIK